MVEKVEMAEVVEKVVADILFLRLLVILVPRFRIGYSFTLFHTFTLSHFGRIS